MFIVCGQPVMDIAMIFRPFYWGYLFLSAGKGLAFFWYGRWADVFTVKLTGKDLKALDVTYILSDKGNLEQFAGDGVDFIRVKGENYYIYKMKSY